MMKWKAVCVLTLFALSFSVQAKDHVFEGKIIDGGGIDDSFLTLANAKGQKITAYCNISSCENLFTDATEDGVKLKPRYKGKKVRMVLSYRPNRGAIAGPGDDDMLDFVKKIQWIRN